MASISLNPSTKLHTFIECRDPRGMIFTSGVLAGERICYVTVLLTRLSSHYDFDYSEYSLKFRDGNSHRVLWETEDLYLFENEYDDLRVKKLHVGFILSKWPKRLELILPPVVIDGSLHEIPIIRFEHYSDKIYFMILGALGNRP